MKYDFTSIIDRRGRDAIAVDGLKGDGFSPAPPKEGFDAIPMWVADMNFPTVPTIQEAIIERAKHPAFGYFQAPAEYFDSIIRWHETRNGVTGLKPEHIGYENGVLGGVISALNCVCSRGDKVLIHTPTQSVSEDARMRTAAFYAPSKTFNLAGLVGSYHIVYNDWWRDRILKESSLNHYNMMNVLSMHALMGAYKPEGYEWADELCEVLTGNIDFACDYIANHFEGVKVAKPEGTYMLFVDCTDWCAAHGKTIEDVEQACWDVGVAIQDGRMFHGPCHLRMNLASPRSRIEEAFRRMDRYVFNA